MAKRCEITKKKKKVANNVSHSKRRTKRVQEPNLQWKRFWDEDAGKWVRLRVAASTIRSISKLGFSKVKKKLSK